MLHEDPSPQMVANFDKFFAPAGLKAADVLKKLNPAASAATAPAEAAPSPEPTVREPPRFIGPALERWIEHGLNPEPTARGAEHRLREEADQEAVRRGVSPFAALAAERERRAREERERGERERTETRTQRRAAHERQEAADQEAVRRGVSPFAEQPPR